MGFVFDSGCRSRGRLLCELTNMIKGWESEGLKGEKSEGLKVRDTYP